AKPGRADIGRRSMPIAISCPSCKARCNAPDTAAGKKVKCPKCQSLISVPAGGSSPAAPTQKQPAAAPSKAPPKKSEPQDDFNFDEPDERPTKKSAPTK